MPAKEELLAKAQKPSEDAMRLHPFYKGKIEVVSKCVIRDFDDFAIWYTPGVGSLKLAFLEQDIGPVSIDVMSSIKEALDPKGILNPGKVVPGRLSGPQELFSWSIPRPQGYTSAYSFTKTNGG